LRYFVGALAFGFAAVWILASLAAALVCLSSAVVAYGAVLVVEGTRAKLATRAGSRAVVGASLPAVSSGRSDAEDLSLWADALNSDLGHVYEPAATTSPVTRDAEYGWPLTDDTAPRSEALH
jgi:2-methylisocitrate lyase-like PEP mutase family enzyme